MPSDSQIGKNHQEPGKERELKKFFNPNENISLTMEDDNEVFDQFKDKKSTYDEKYYTSKINYANITETTRKTAERVEKELEMEPKSHNVHIQEERN